MLKTIMLTLAGTVLLAAGTDASVLPQIDRAQALQAQQLAGDDALRKHFVEIEPGVYQAVKGKRERRQIRFARWRALLGGDRARLYATLGHPSYRHLELAGGVTREFWTYPKQMRTYVFEGDRLISGRPF